MKINRKGKKSTQVTSASVTEVDSQERHMWKILVVDDEPDVHEITRLNLKGFRFEERNLKFLQANSAAEAKVVLKDHEDIALALIDVVMETDDAGLKLVEYIRDELNNKMMRLIIRTGQPGLAPERFVIDHFDIDDYKDKTDLTVHKLYTTVRSALKSYRDLLSIDMNRRGLISILEATPKIYNNSRQSLPQFFQGILTQIVALFNLDANAMISTIDGVIATIDGEEVKVRAGTGEFEGVKEDNERLHELIQLCSHVVKEGGDTPKFRESSIVIPMKIENNSFGFIYIETTSHLSEADYNLLQLFANQCSAALESINLHFDLKKSYNHAIDMLAVIAEFRDSTTGNHINRLALYTTIVSLELGYSHQEAEMFGQSARLHDVGKVGIADAILLKKDRLTTEEFEQIKTHTTIGVDILEGDERFILASEVSHYHHERWDGNGYPTGIKGEEIPTVARIVSVIDVFDALISVRPYKNAWTPEEAIEEIKKGSATQFDPKVVETFVSLYNQGRFDPIINSMKNGG